MSRPLAYDRANALNAICPYFTMFPLEYPLRVLKAHKHRNSVVMDPFCGRGTTLFAARRFGMVARGIDSSPIAVAIARAKLATAETEEIIDLAMSYIAVHRSAVAPKSDFFKSAFSPSVLAKICAIRKGLMNQTNDNHTTVMLRAAMLGCLHGPLNKDPNHRSYFSNQMPRTFSPKPDYSVRYWRERKMQPPEVDVLNVLRRKLDRLPENPLPLRGRIKNVRHGDSRLATSIPSSSRDFSIVVTSPPYYGMRTYVQDQWLRNWFLGGPDQVEYSNDFQLEHAGKEVFARSLGLVWKNMARTRSEELDMYIRFGIIPSSKVDAKAILRASLKSSGITWREISVRVANTASEGKRQANHMASTSCAAVEYDFHVKRA